MQVKQILFTGEAQEKIANGVNIIADCVAATMGPKGQVVLIENFSTDPSFTKDGVSVAKQVELSDKFEKIGADAVKEAASKTNEVAGDGTTTATVLARAIYREGHKLIAAGENPVIVKRGIDQATAEAVKELVSMAVPVDSLEKLEQVASISANDKELGRIIAGVIEQVGKDGLITVEENASFGIETELTNGMKLESGFISPYMVTDPSSMKAELNDCPVLVTDKRITMVTELLPVLDKLAKSGKKELLIIADNVEGEAFSFLVVNKQHGTFTAVVVRATGIGDHRKREQLRDICAATGALFVSDDTGKKLEDLKLEDLGKVRKAVVTKDFCTLIDGAGKKEDVETRIGAIKAELATTKSDYDQIKLKERLGRLTGSVGVIKIGGTNEVEIKEKKQRVEDALNATRAAQDEGIVVGGGVSLLRVSQALKTDLIGSQCVRNALTYPLTTIAENGGKNGQVVLEKCLAESGDFGYDAGKDEYGNLMERGIIDPVKVTRTALENAASIAGLLLTSKAVIVIEPEKK